MHIRPSTCRFYFILSEDSEKEIPTFASIGHAPCVPDCLDSRDRFTNVFLEFVEGHLPLALTKTVFAHQWRRRSGTWIHELIERIDLLPREESKSGVGNVELWSISCRHVPEQPITSVDLAEKDDRLLVKHKHRVA